ncbi:SURF1 family protein [Pararhodobacter sp.]|uniref:SURF1 family protein n=1 Tax=Pararhodobacter sp. TaxID=2127056 RepID=UPI002AFEBEF2|nr:SURF1 family protein [Pararhodobacter sp.]
MLKRMIGPLIFGVGGLAILLSLGFWQLARLDWKLGVIANIEARIHAAPVPVPAAPEAGSDRYLPVTATGEYNGEVVHVLSSQREQGTGSHVIAVLEMPDGRRILVDRGFMSDATRRDAVLTARGVEVTGNLLWPLDSDSYTPAPDLNRNLWFSRDIEPIAEYLGTEEVMIIARTDTPPVPGLVPVPINTADIKNDHLGYALTWFSLAFVWAVMTAILLWRIRRNTA